MKLEWEDNNGDAKAQSLDAIYDIEQSAENRWWVFKDERPLGIYDSMEKAKARAQEVADTHRTAG